ncbi:hypothetical protein [Salimicrobium jeotgali]|uniref:hypothetical protein n=1 Tax=Salimicrobium jeotgali TaxID=1230341 RepID=UPI000C81574B|nr:hypothetical protein [Salimicrobium jeotgali]
MEVLLREIKTNLQADVVAIAEWKKKEASIQWSHTVGMNTDKHLHVRILYGLGIVGKVMQSGTPMYYYSDAEAHEDPLVYSESLKSFFLVPLASGASLPSVMMVGYRTTVDLPGEKQWGLWRNLLTEKLKGGEPS